MSAEVFFQELSGKNCKVGNTFLKLTELGWKVDAEESDLMNRFSKTFRKEGIKAYLILEDFVCFPPDGDESLVESVSFYSFDPETFPALSMNDIFERERKANDDTELYQDCEMLLAYADPQDCGVLDSHWEQLTKIEYTDVPTQILEQVFQEIKANIVIK